MRLSAVVLVGIFMESKKQKTKNIFNDKLRSDDINTSSEEELLQSSQDSVNNAGTSKGNPVENKVPSKVPVKTNKQQQEGHTSRGGIPQKKSAKYMSKRRHKYAQFILSKVRQNESAGIVDDRDAYDKKKYLAIVAEFEAQAKANKTTVNASRQDTKKRVRSLDGSFSPHVPVAKKSKPIASTTVLPTILEPQQQRLMSEVVRDQLQLAVVDELAPRRLVSAELWTRVEGRLSELVLEHVLAENGEPVPCFDSSEVVRGYRVIRCADQFSRNFLGRIASKIGYEWEGSRIGLIPANEIPRRPRARIWIPKMEVDGVGLLKCLKLQNPKIPMDNWSVIKKELPLKNSQSFLLMINEECIEPLASVEYKLNFGIRLAKVKIFGATTPIDAVVETEGLMDDMSLGPVEDSSPMSSMRWSSTENSTMVSVPDAAVQTGPVEDSSPVNSMRWSSTGNSTMVSVPDAAVPTASSPTPAISAITAEVAVATTAEVAVATTTTTSTTVQHDGGGSG